MQSVLVLGGTNFIGRNLVERLIELGNYEICLFNLGESNSKLFPSLKKLTGDRYTSDLDQIFQEPWDYIIDVSCYYPKSLERIIAGLKSKPKKYIFISTCSVYDNEQFQGALRDESAGTLSCTDLQKEDTSPDTYGNRKVECENLIMQSDLDYILLRPALVYGQYDPTDRFYYWLHQIKTQNQLLLPEKGERLFSVTYVHDLVEAIVKSIKSSISRSIYNITSTPQCSIKQIVEQTSIILNKSPKLLNAPGEFLEKMNIKEWMDMPLWISNDYFTYDNTKIRSELNFTPIAFKESLRQTINYYESLNWPIPKFGITEEKRKNLVDCIMKLVGLSNRLN